MNSSAAHTSVSRGAAIDLLDLAISNADYPRITPAFIDGFRPYDPESAVILVDAVLELAEWPDIADDATVWAERPAFAFEYNINSAQPLFAILSATIVRTHQPGADFDVSTSFGVGHVIDYTLDPGRDAAIHTATAILDRARHTYALACDVVDALAATHEREQRDAALAAARADIATAMANTPGDAAPSDALVRLVTEVVEKYGQHTGASGYPLNLPSVKIDSAGRPFTGVAMDTPVSTFGYDGLSDMWDFITWLYGPPTASTEGDALGARTSNSAPRKDAS